MMYSPRGSTSSDDAASYNGRLALEEVVAKLNDLDQNSNNNNNNNNSSSFRRRGSNGPAGVASNSSSLVPSSNATTSASLQSKSGLGVRLPFLSALFASNNRAADYSILTDEEDRNQEDNPWLDIFLWRFPLVSLVWFLVTQLLFFSLHSGFSLVTIAALLGLWQTCMDAALSRLVPQLQAKGLFNAELKIDDALRRNAFFNDALIKRGAGVVYEIADLAIGLWRFTVEDAQLASVLVAFRFVFVVFIRAFSVMTTMWLVFLVFFTIPISYHAQRQVADLVADAGEERKLWVRRYVTQLADGVARETEGRAQAHFKLKRALAEWLRAWVVGGRG